MYASTFLRLTRVPPVAPILDIASETKVHAIEKEATGTERLKNPSFGERPMHSRLDTICEKISQIASIQGTIPMWRGMGGRPVQARWQDGGALSCNVLLIGEGWHNFISLKRDQAAEWPTYGSPTARSKTILCEGKDFDLGRKNNKKQTEKTQNKRDGLEYNYNWKKNKIMGVLVIYCLNHQCLF